MCIRDSIRAIIYDKIIPYGGLPMKTLHGLDYSLKIKNTIINHINQAQKNPFINYYFIVDDPLYFEEAFFKYTDTLFNIRIITYNDLIKKLLERCV